MCLQASDTALKWTGLQAGWPVECIEPGSAAQLTVCINEYMHCRWYRPGPPFVSTAVVQWIRKRLGYVPLLMWGRWGTFVPHKVRIALAQLLMAPWAVGVSAHSLNTLSWTGQRPVSFGSKLCIVHADVPYRAGTHAPGYRQTH